METILLHSLLKMRYTLIFSHSTKLFIYNIYGLNNYVLGTNERVLKETTIYLFSDTTNYFRHLTSKLWFMEKLKVT